MFRQELSSSIIFTLISDIDLKIVDEKFIKKTGTTNKSELGFSNYGELARGLKEIVFECINHNNDVYYYEKRGKVVLKYLRDFFTDNPSCLPPEYRAKKIVERNSLNKDIDTYQQRLICDYISGMMDSYAIGVYEQISGKSFNDILGD